METKIRVLDADGHIIESIPEMAQYMDPAIREVALRPSRNRQGVFAGLDAFAYASDYPHEVDVVAAEQMIQETLDRPDITWEEKAGVLGENARRFFKL